MQNERKLVENDIKSIAGTLTMTQDDSPNKTLLLVRLGMAHDRRFDILHELDDNQQAIENWTKALSRTSDNRPLMLYLRDSLGTAHQQRFQRLGKMEDMDKAIEYARLALALTPDGHQDLPRQLGNLGSYHRARFRRLSKVEDLEQAMDYDSRAIVATPDGHPQLPRVLGNLGTSHYERFRHLGELADLEKAIQYQSRAVDSTPDGHPELPSRLNNLGASHVDRFRRLGELVDLEEAIRFQSRALSLTPDDHPNFPSMLINLGTYHADHFKHLGELVDLEKAIRYRSRGVDLTLTATHTCPRHSLTWGRLIPIDSGAWAIHYESRALDLTPDGHPDKSSCLANFGISHTQRFGRLGELDDLEKAIQCLSRAVNLAANGHPDLSGWFASLGTSHSYRFERLGELVDLEKAIQYHYRAVELTPDGHPNLSIHLTDLGTSHIYRCKRLGELTDLEKAIQYHSRAVELTPDGHPELSGRLTNLGRSYGYRFERLGKLDALEKAIQYQTHALDMTPDGHPNLSSRLANLGTPHSHRFKRLGKLADLEKAIQYESRAIDLTPDDHPDLSGWLTNLGTSYKDRFDNLGDLGDLEKAIHCQSRAIASTPDGHPHLAGIHLNFAQLSFTRYLHTNNYSHLGQSLHSFRLATQSTTSAPRDRFQYAYQWARFASKHGTLNPIEAFQTTIDVLPQFIWLGATTTQRYEDLFTTETLAVDAAHAAILSSNHTLALEWLEHARCVVWTQHLMLRSPLDQLQSSHPALAARIQKVATQLHNAGSDTRESRAVALDSKNAEEVAQEHRRLAREYDELITQVRNLAGFEDFLRPMKAKDLVHAARHGPVVVINCHADRCDALIIQSGQDYVDHVPLPGFNREKARQARSHINQSLGRKGLRERGVKTVQEVREKDQFGSALAALWNNIVKPVLDFLGYTYGNPRNPLPHITWCPTGALSFLPLHAAGEYDQPRSRVFEYVISSYTPTLTALLSSTPSSLSHTSGVLGIGLQFTPGHNHLPGTAGELTCVQEHVKATANYSQLFNGQATKTAVLDAMEKHNWVHLACHAHQNAYDPTKSGFFLHDGTLDLASINRRSFRNKGLAFLSACQTAKGDEALPDEAVHLASGMLMAGYTSVIATMWSVVDADAPVVADGVYAELMKDGKVGSGEAGRALHDAVAVLRTKVGEQAFERWVSYIHIGS